MSEYKTGDQVVLLTSSLWFPGSAVLHTVTYKAKAGESYAVVVGRKPKWWKWETKEFIVSVGAIKGLIEEVPRKTQEVVA